MHLNFVTRTSACDKTLLCLLQVACLEDPLFPPLIADAGDAATYRNYSTDFDFEYDDVLKEVGPARDRLVTCDITIAIMDKLVVPRWTVRSWGDGGRIDRV